MAEPLCALCDAEKYYGGARVLGPLSLSVAPGEVLGLRGRNGAGKSTAMSLMAGIIKPDAGAVTRSPRARSLTGYVPQELSLYEELTVNENLKFWGLAMGLPPKAISARSRWLIGRLGLEGREKSAVSELSGGMKRRIHLASALMVTPALLLLDEPTVGADEESRRVILELISHLRTLGAGTVLITHREDELDAAADRVLTLEGGLIVEGAMS